MAQRWVLLQGSVVERGVFPRPIRKLSRVANHSKRTAFEDVEFATAAVTLTVARYDCASSMFPGACAMKGLV